MAYIGGPFDYDVFVSYSHGDVDATGESKIKQWSQAFARELESEYRAHPKFGHDFRIFLDQHHRPLQGIDPLYPLTEQLQSDIARSAILTVLMSPHYLDSKWCQDEREWWHSKQAELGLVTEGRIAVVRIWPTEKDWPKELTDSRGEQLVGFCFYDKSEAELRPQPYEWPEPTCRSGNPFRKELLDLVGRIGLKLGELRRILDGRRRAQEEAANLSAAGGQVVYLHGRTDFASAWERAAEALTGIGLAVLPGEPDPVESEPAALQKIRRHRVATMSACDAVLLVGPDYGRAVDEDLVVIGRNDRNSARAISNKLLPCALLDNVGAAIATPMRKVAAKRLDVEWIDATAEPWTPAVQQWLSRAGSAGANT
jgi:hypothetical protein